MKTIHLCALLLACAVAAPLFGQQKTYNWVTGSDETVSLDPGYYHAGPTVQPSPKNLAVHIDVDARRPVRIAMVSAQEWNDAAQNPDALQDLKYVCVQEHVVKATYACTPPAGVPMVVVVRDERDWHSGSYFGQVTSRHDRPGQYADRAMAAAAAERQRRDSVSANSVHLQYYDWGCTDNCNLPDPPQPKVFNWVASNNESVRLDPTNYYASHTFTPGAQGTQMEIEARYPVTIAMVDSSAWTQAIQQPSAARNLSNLTYNCVQQHAVKTTYTCRTGAFWSQTLVIWDEREARHDHDGDRDHDRDDDRDRAQGYDGNRDRGQGYMEANASPHVFPAGVPGAPLTDRDEGRRWVSPNDIRIQYYSWGCVEYCDQPDFGWVRQVKEKYPLTKVLKVYAGLTPDHDGTQLSIKVKSPVPMAVAVLPSSIAGQLYGSPDMFESAVGKSACQQRGVQSSTLQCTLNLADGSQSLVLLPEAGVDIPKKKKAEVEVQTTKCIGNCNFLPNKN
jgi:hypothetical protein